MGFPGGSDGKVSDCNARDQGLSPGLGITPGRRNGNPLQYSCLENSMDRGAWQATVWVTKSWTWLKWLSPPAPYKSKDWLRRREESLPNSFPQKVPWEQKHKNENWSDWRSKPRPPLTVQCACVLSCSLNCVQLFATPWTAACQAPPIHGDSPGKNTGVGCISSSRGSSQPRDWTHVSYTAGGFFTTEPPGKPNSSINRLLWLKEE